MRMPLTLTVLAAFTLAGPTTSLLQAQQPKFDSVTYKRAHKPLLRWGEVIGVAATTVLAVALDKSLRNTISDPHDSFGRTASDIGNAQGSPFVYPTLLAFMVAGKVIPSRGMYG
ncbi:MAG TPA: hypothetical protein VFU23_15650, partial [Gemmatimonadales bacterium]|nr:hypothetical protein [Gemmatimonadales bacterium]